MKTFIAVVVVMLAFVGDALASEPTAASNAKAIDTIWVLVSAFLVFFMQAGFALCESGFTRAKNACNIIMKNLVDFAAGSVAFWILGFAIMFGADRAGLFGTSGFFLSAGDPSTPDGQWQMAYFLFQLMFAGTAATIASGAMAERTKFASYIAYSFLMSALIYPVVGHWVWGGGWLAKLGMIDFAGSTVVHTVGAVAGFVGAVMLGARTGKYVTNGKATVSKAIPGHSIPLAALGVFILWFGWFGFNPGSTLSGTNLSIATIALTTSFAAAAGTLAAMFVSWARFKKPDPSMTLNGALAGLVAITAGCATVSPGSALIIGGVAGALVVVAVEFIDKVLHVDDPVGAVSVHGIAGIFGTLAVGLFAESRYALAAGLPEVNGLFFGGGLRLLGIQALGSAAVVCFALVALTIVFVIIKKTFGLRASAQEEARGLDIAEHGMEAYSGFQIFSNK